MWHEVLVVMAVSYGCLVLLAHLIPLAGAARNACRAFRARRRARAVRARWSIALLVRVDGAAGVLRPSIQLTGGSRLKRPSIRLALVDARGKLRHTAVRALEPTGLDAELALPAFAAADLEATTGDVVRWKWDVALRDGRQQRARLKGPLRPAGATNPEAELTLVANGSATEAASLYLAGCAGSPRGGGRWWETPFGRWRLAAEVEAMRRFPAFSLHGSPGALCWLGRLESALTPGSSYLLRVAYPDRFPDEPPRVRIEEPSLPPSTPHLLAGDSPCLYYSAHGPANGYDAARTTAATLVAWTALWLHAYETWLSTGAWPGRAD